MQFGTSKFSQSMDSTISHKYKKKVSKLIRNCKVMMNDFLTHVNVNIIPLGSYDLLIGMDLLEEHKFVLNCFDKTFTCTDDSGNNINLKGSL